MGRPKQKVKVARAQTTWSHGPRERQEPGGVSHEQRRGNLGCAQQDASDGSTGTGEGGAGIRAEVTALVQGQMMGPRGLRGRGAAAGALQRHRP